MSDAETFDCFLSYRRRDKAAVFALADGLRARGISLWIDEERLRPGIPWQPLLEAGIRESRSVAVLVGADAIGPWKEEEMRAALALAVTDGRAVIPVLLADAPAAPELPLFLSGRTWVDLRPAADASEASGLDRLVWGITGRWPARDGAGHSPDGESPDGSPGIDDPDGEPRAMELRPVESRPLRFSVRVLALSLLAVMALAAAGLYGTSVLPASHGARDALRMARYDLALDELAAVPGWLRGWPGLGALRAKAELGADFYVQRPDWERQEARLRRLLAAAPADADLQVLDASLRQRRGDWDGARAAAQAASGADPANAEAWYLLGLDLDLRGDPQGAIAPYRRATDAAPSSPQYRSNLARALLDTGRFDAALKEYETISRFALARIEQGLALWARGRPREAAGVQAQALAMLEDSALVADFYNRRAWVFRLSERLPDQGLRLAALPDKQCYAALAETASRALAGDALPVPPAACPDPPEEIRLLVADDLCRFVDPWQPGLAPAAARLRRSLGQPADCPARPVPAAAGSARAR